MKKLLLPIFLIGIINYAQQNTGINTTTPTETLDVNGTLRVRTTAEATEPTNTIAVDQNGVVVTKPATPANQSGLLNAGDTFATNVRADLFVPIMITAVPNASASGYFFTIENNLWILNAINLSNVSTGTAGIYYEILWIPR